eukprot:2895581-Rhodomonas_salina.4
MDSLAITLKVACPQSSYAHACCYPLTTQCPVPTEAMLLRTRNAMCVIGTGYAPTQSLSDVRYQTRLFMLLRTHYTVSGTHIGYTATLSLPDVRYQSRPFKCCYALTTRCPVLT